MKITKYSINRLLQILTKSQHQKVRKYYIEYRTRFYIKSVYSCSQSMKHIHVMKVVVHIWQIALLTGCSSFMYKHWNSRLD